MEKPKAKASMKPQMDQHAQTSHVEKFEINNRNHGSTAEFAVADEFWPLSGKPFFDVIIGKTQIKPSYQLHIPARVHQLLPNTVVPVVLDYCGKSWKLVYHENSGPKRFGRSWRNFVTDNNLRVGDACVFELTECSSSSNDLKFKVQSSNSPRRFPPELLAKAKGGTSNAPICID